VSPEPEPWLLPYTLSAFVVLLLAISTLFSLGGYLLRPWFDRWERLLHALPPDQYLSFFAFPLSATILGGIVNVGAAWLILGGLETGTGLSILGVVLGCAIYFGLAATRQLVNVRRKDAIELARSGKPAPMRFASAELVRSVNTLMADAPIVDIRRARFDSKKLRKIHDDLNSLMNKLPQQEPMKRLVTRSRELAAGHTRLVTLATLAAAVLAIVATVVRIVAGGDVLRAASLGALLLLLAVGMWWAGMWLRARTHADRYAALKEQLSEELNEVRSGLDDIDQRINGSNSAIWISGGPADGETLLGLKRS